MISEVCVCVTKTLISSESSTVWVGSSVGEILKIAAKWKFRSKIWVTFREIAVLASVQKPQTSTGVTNVFEICTCKPSVYRRKHAGMVKGP